MTRWRCWKKASKDRDDDEPSPFSDFENYCMRRLHTDYHLSHASIAPTIFLIRLSSIISLLYHTPHAPIPPLIEVLDLDVECQLTRKHYTTSKRAGLENAYHSTCEPMLENPDTETLLIRQLCELTNSPNGMVRGKARDVYERYMDFEEKAQYEREEASRRSRRLRKVPSALSIMEDAAQAARDRERELRDHYAGREARPSGRQQGHYPLTHWLKDPMVDKYGRGGYQGPRSSRWSERSGGEFAKVEDWRDDVAKSGHGTRYEVIEPEEENVSFLGHSWGGKYLAYGEGR